MNIARLLFRLLLGRRLPITSGALEVPGVKRPLLLRRDQYGIAYIEAEEDEDAWYGLGFCQGQDRAFQIETMLRVARGTTAELAGPEALPVDRISRRIGIRYAADQPAEAIDDETQRLLEAFCLGITDGARIGCRRSAHEFSLLRMEPTPYRPADVVGMIKLMGITLPSNWDTELARLKILTTDGPEALKALDPTYPEWLPVTAPPSALAGRAVDRLADDLAILTAATGLGGGSNNWALAPSRTVSGRPILANDPHLGPTLPPHFYLAHLRTPDWVVAGGCFVGTPGIFVGYNGVAAWGVTAGFIDNADLFIEEMGPDGRSVREGDRFVPCEVRQEVIKAKGQEPFEEEILVTPRGPIISPALEGEVGAISLRATWLDPKLPKRLMQMHRSRTFEEFRRCFEEWPASSQNMVYADTSGTIGWQLAGEVPRRRKGWGTVPLAGWDPEVGWEDEPVPFDEMPHASNPEIGFVATANNQPVQEGTGPFLGVDWIDGYRVARIVEALDARHDWDLPATQALQMDQQSIPWRELRDTVLAIPPDTEEVRLALTLLGSWDGRVAADSTAAAVFEFFLAEMFQRVVKAKAPGAAEWALGKTFHPLVPNMFPKRGVSFLVRLLREEPQGWFERPWPQELADALATVIRTLRGRYGEKPEKWAWGLVRPVTLRHPLGGRALFAGLFNRGPFPWGGDGNTVAQATAPHPREPTSSPFAIAALRMVVDVGNWQENRFAMPGGQSGNPLSPHYDDLLPFWLRGEGVPIAWSPDAVARVTKSTMRLMPG